MILAMPLSIFAVSELFSPSHVANSKQIDLSNTDLDHLSAKEAHDLIDANIKNQFGNLTGPATEKQRQMIRALARAGAITYIPADEWRNLTKQRAFEIISAVPEDKRREIMAQRREQTAPAPSGKDVGRGIE